MQGVIFGITSFLDIQRIKKISPALILNNSCPSLNSPISSHLPSANFLRVFAATLGLVRDRDSLSFAVCAGTSTLQFG